jgi:hypothetical protein
MFKETKRKGFNFFRSYYDVFNELPEEDKLTFIKALLDRQFLGVKPEGLEGMAKFAWISQVNSIDSQVKGYEDKTRTKLTPTEGGVNSPSRQVEEKEKEKVQVKEKVENKKKFVFRKALLDFGFNSELIDDWLMVRKQKKASNTETAYKGFINQVEKSGKDKNEVLKLVVEKSWISFKSEWLNNISDSNNNSGNGSFSHNRY